VREDLTAHGDEWKAEKLFLRGEHPATGVSLDLHNACAHCRSYTSAPQPDRGVCGQSQARTRGSWQGCALWNERPPLDVSARGVSGVLHPQTSQRAGKTVRAGSQQAALLIAMAGRRRGLTAKEGVSVVDRSVNQIGARLLELRTAGFARYVEPGDGIESERDGALVHLVTDAGRHEAFKLRS